ncbi:MAG: hypothetical protein LQ346_005964 [Caloplaca aetnensis]|nr:MAG: hypothetical protein LQ346_005964 [Caloplaca aetnensis]
MLTRSGSDSDLSDVMEVEWPEEQTQKPEIKTEIDEEYTELYRTGYNLRRRSTLDNGRSPYLAPWQNERRSATAQRRQSKPQIEKPDVDIKLEDETEDDEDLSQRLASIPLAGSLRPGHGFQMMLEAAAWFEANEIPCTSFGCPIQEPHGEGFYRYEGEVLNSELANQYFWPSVPPPAVVEAFNAIAGKPSWDDLKSKDRFFEFHTEPCRPSKHLSRVWKLPCKAAHCGMLDSYHNKGVYLHKGLDASLSLGRRVKHSFGISNPPPEIWAAAMRIEEGTATPNDQELVDDFSAHHVRFEWRKDNAEALKAFTAWQKQRKSERP